MNENLANVLLAALKSNGLVHPHDEYRIRKVLLETLDVHVDANDVADYQQLQLLKESLRHAGIDTSGFPEADFTKVG